jgi:putative hydrolase
LINIIADTHTHTITSAHAYSTLQEMVHAAAQKDLYAIAITDHGKEMPDPPGKWYFQNLTCVPHLLENVLVLRGQEADVIDAEGHLDIEKDDGDALDWVVASIHSDAFKDRDQTVEAITNAWMNIAKNPMVHVIGHSGTEEYKYDYEPVLKEFGRQGKLVEINESTFRVRKTSIPNCKRIVEICKKYGVEIIVNSDAHFSAQVGKFPNSLRLLEELDFPEELVVNSSVERFQHYLSRYTHVFDDPEITDRPALS